MKKLNLANIGSKLSRVAMKAIVGGEDGSGYCCGMTGGGTDASWPKAIQCSADGGQSWTACNVQYANCDPRLFNAQKGC